MTQLQLTTVLCNSGLRNRFKQNICNELYNSSEALEQQIPLLHKAENRWLQL